MQVHASNTPGSATASRDIALEMSNFMLAHPGCTREQLREQFTVRQIDRHAAEAKSIADRRVVKRVA